MDQDVTFFKKMFHCLLRKKRDAGAAALYGEKH